MGCQGAYRIKATPGITAWSGPIVHIDGLDRDLDVGLAHPPGEEAGKGWSVRPLKCRVSWVQNVGSTALDGSNVVLALAVSVKPKPDPNRVW